MSVDEKTKERRRQLYLEKKQEYESLSKTIEIPASIENLYKKAEFYFNDDKNLLTAIGLINSAVNELERRKWQLEHHYPY